MIILQDYTTIEAQVWIRKKIMDEFQKMECNFAEVAKEFKLIEENTKTIFINRSLKQMNYYRNYELKE